MSSLPFLFHNRGTMRRVDTHSFNKWMAYTVQSIHYGDNLQMEKAFENLNTQENEANRAPTTKN